MGEKPLKVAVGAAVAEVVVLMGALIAQGALSGAPLRVVFLATKLPLCWLALQRRPAGFLGLWLYEIAAIAAALGSDGPALGRIGIAAMAIIVMILLGRASSAFPPVEWKSR